MKSKNLILDICLTAIFAALIAIATMVLQIPLAYGYLNCGDLFIFCACFVLRPRYAAAAAGIGSAIADLIAFPLYAPVTLVVKAIMAFTAGLIMYKRPKIQYNLLAFVTAGIIMLAGYFVFEGFYYGWAGAIANIPLSSIQPAVCTAVALGVVEILKRVPQITAYREKNLSVNEEEK